MRNKKTARPQTAVEKPAGINWKISKKDANSIRKVIERAINLPNYKEGSLPKSILMDITATHLNGTPLDFNKLLAFDDFSFAHDIFGINNNINRKTGKLENCFLPRCSKGA